MDFSSFDLKEMAGAGAEYHLRSYLDDEPMYTEAGKPITFTVLGKDSKEFRGVVARMVAKSQAKMKGQRKGKDMSEAEILKAMDEREGNGAETIAQIVTASSGVEWEGKPVGNDKAKLVALFTQHPWIVEQLDAFINDREVFFENAKRN